MSDERLTADEMDEQRRQNIAYQYLCHLEETKRWMESCLNEELPPPTELEESLRNGVTLAKLGNFFAPEIVPLKKIYDRDQLRYKAAGLHFRHTDNINHWRHAMSHINLPTLFQPETTDVYDKKNMPRVVYCIHALSLYLFKLGLAPQIQDLYGKVNFTVHAAVIAINEAVDRGVVRDTMVALRNPNAMLVNLQEKLAAVYQELLHQAKSTKMANARNKVLQRSSDAQDVYDHCLTQAEVQGNINKVNVHAALEYVDEALERKEVKTLYATLQDSALLLRGLQRENADWYLEQLASDREQKALELGYEDLLEKEELQAGVDAANQYAASERAMEQAVFRINNTIRNGQATLTMKELACPDAQLPDVYPCAADLYQQELSVLQRQSPQVGLVPPVLYIQGSLLTMLASGYFAKLRKRKRRSQGGCGFLSWNDLQLCVSNINHSTQEEHDKILAVSLINEALEQNDPQKTFTALLLPAAALTDVTLPLANLYHQILTSDLQHKKKAARDDSAALWLEEIQEGVSRANQENARAQKMALGIAAINQAIKEGKPSQTLRVLQNPDALLCGVVSDCANGYQSELGKMMNAKRKPGSATNYWVRHRIKERGDYFFHLRSFEGVWEQPAGFSPSTTHLSREEMQSAINKVTSGFRREKQWEASEDLLVRLQARMRGYLLRKHLSQRRHLLHKLVPAVTVIQTNPEYMAKLIFQMPQNRSTNFMESVTFTLYNYASNRREAYLLLRLFRTALQEEITSKVDRIQDIITGNPTVIRLLVSFYRSARGQNALRQILGNVVKEVLQDKTINIRINPVEIYKSWVNQVESQTGKKSVLPYDVTPEQALTHSEVQRRLDISIRNLIAVTDRFFSTIFANVDQIPYGMRYVSKVLKDSLSEKFPRAREGDIYKIVGNLLYYRFMNPAVVAPDAFDIVDMSAGGTIHPDQRRTLGSIAKVLQHAAANKMFDDSHLGLVNQFLVETHWKFRKFILTACNVPEPEERFNIDEYSEMVNTIKPVMYMTVGELIDTHKLLLEHQDAIAPDHKDPIHELLEDLGELPTVQSLIGGSASNLQDAASEQALAHLRKLEISLTLTNKFDLLGTNAEEMDTQSLLLSTKHMLVDIIQSQPGDSVPEVLNTSASAQQEASHYHLMHQRALRDAQTPEKMKRHRSLLGDSKLSIEDKKRKVIRNLRKLESLGVVSSHNHYQEIINMIAKDIRNQRRYRQHRKAELVKLHQTTQRLHCKTAFHEEQIDFYNQYIKTCLDNLTANQKPTGKSKKQNSLSYTGTRLHEKGVLLEIEDLPFSQFRNVIFDIAPCEEPGKFQVKTKFLGVDMEKFQLNYQDLLQLQYEGVAVMKMFDKAKVNVNLLIFLLNKKFFRKT
ncbi:hypothetical protein GDO78_015670 [Eleutherodactylus coqui]|uniref:IQ motif containing GTPase activating protein 3 n=1 Tax=Eleutherodactylus coqui TaxID=57060 RepID=A0A8J6EDE5_ELECQ|nr:hypothetical protein GDO78_015670 [Eleutherodactylus coqui]